MTVDAKLRRWLASSHAGVRSVRLWGILPAALLLATTLLVIPALLAGLGFPPLPAMRALWEGSLGSFYALSSGTLVRATPLILTGLAVAVAFRAGVFNVGAEGQLLAGAAAAAAVGILAGRSLGALALPVELLVGVVAGALWAGIAAGLRARFGVLEVISTILLNFIAAYLVAYLVRGPLQEPLHIYPQSASIIESARLPRLLPDTRLHAGFPLALVAAAAMWWVIRATAAGFRLRVVGANPDAARMAGEIDATRTAARAFLASGALAGLAGAIELTGVTFALYENLSPGYGYSGIAVALLARLHPLGVIASGVVFGALESGASAMQRDAGVPSVVVSIAEAVIIILLVLIWRRPVEGRTSIADAAAATASEVAEADR